MDDHLLACQSFLKECHEVTRVAKERASFLKINGILFLERLNVIIVVL
jgi:hypothetical protein